MTENIWKAREIVDSFIGYQVDLPTGREINLNRKQAIQVARFYCMDPEKWPDSLKNFYTYELRDWRAPVNHDHSNHIIASYVVRAMPKDK